ncbi:hypothetical protein D3C71_1308010 [compost metagenome]
MTKECGDDDITDPQSARAGSGSRADEPFGWRPGQQGLAVAPRKGNRAGRGRRDIGHAGAPALWQAATYTGPAVRHRKPPWCERTYRLDRGQECRSGRLHHIAQHGIVDGDGRGAESRPSGSDLARPGTRGAILGGWRTAGGECVRTGELASRAGCPAAQRSRQISILWKLGDRLEWPPDNGVDQAARRPEHQSRSVQDHSRLADGYCLRRDSRRLARRRVSVGLYRTRKATAHCIDRHRAQSETARGQGTFRTRLSIYRCRLARRFCPQEHASGDTGTPACRHQS